MSNDDTSDSGAPLSTEAFCRWARETFGPTSVSAEAISDFAERHQELDSKLSEELHRYGIACGVSALEEVKKILEAAIRTVSAAQAIQQFSRDAPEAFDDLDEVLGIIDDSGEQR